MSSLIKSYIGGDEYQSSSGEYIPVINPANEEIVGQLECIDAAGVEFAIQSTRKGFALWSTTSSFQRSRIIAKAIDILRSKKNELAVLITTEQGKPLHEAEGEVESGCDNAAWMAEEATRIYGRTVPHKNSNIDLIVEKAPIGPALAICAWNFPLLTPLRKVSAALAAGCSVLLKPSEETPSAAIEIFKAFKEAGLPDDVLNVIQGDGRLISEKLIPSPEVKKVSFTGSVEVGKKILLACAHTVKATTMELGGHAPVIVCDDVDVEKVARMCMSAKFKNAGQICISPTRFLIQRGIYREFIDKFTCATKALRIYPGSVNGVDMGPLANGRRIIEMEKLVEDLISKGAKLECGGQRISRKGFFFEPTVFSDVPMSAQIMRLEPFGPIVPIIPFDEIEDAIAEANRLDLGLAAYAMTQSQHRTRKIMQGVQSGMLCFNHFSPSIPSSPFGGVKESGLGSEGGTEGIEAYLVTRSVTLNYVD